MIDATGEEIDASEARVRSRVLTIARGELGPGRPKVYWRDVLGPEWRGPPPVHWCGGFVLWCLHQAGIAPHVLWKFEPERQLYGFLYHLPHARTPEPGDVVYFRHFQHHAILVGVDGQALLTIDGNTPTVAECRHPAKYATIYSIKPWLPYEPPDTVPP